MSKNQKPVIWKTSLQHLIEDRTIPKTTLQLIKEAVKPYWVGVSAFFGLSFIGILAWAGSPYAIRTLIDELSKHQSVTSWAKALVVIYVC